MKNIKSKKRVKELGEVFTPPALVNEILDSLPAHVWHPKKTFMEPSCGTGNFLVEIAKRKLKHGHDPHDVAQSLFGIDIMEDNVRECRERLVKLLGDQYASIINENIECRDALK